MHITALIGLVGMLLAGPGDAQVRSIDPNQGIDRDLSTPDTRAAAAQKARIQASQSTPSQADYRDPDQQVPASPAPATPGYRTPEQARAEATTQSADTYQREDLIGAGEGVFGKGAEGLAGIIEKILKDQGPAQRLYCGPRSVGRVRRRATLWVGHP